MTASKKENTQTQLQRLAEPFPQQSIKTKPDSSRASYVSHSVVTQKALEILGPYSLEVGALIRGTAPEVPGKNGKPGFPAVQNAVTGALVTIKVTIDGESIAITEVGECENPAVRKTDGERAKMAVSDGVKRCWMRAGLGLHLWSGEDYTLAENMAEPAAPEPPSPDAWEGWNTRGDAIKWALEVFDAEGTAVFAAPKHAAYSFDKLFRAHLDSLPPNERITKESPQEAKDNVLRQVLRLWNLKVIAKYEGREYAAPKPWKAPGGDDLPLDDAPAAEEQVAAPAPAGEPQARESVTV